LDTPYDLDTLPVLARGREQHHGVIGRSRRRANFEEEEALQATQTSFGFDWKLSHFSVEGEFKSLPESTVLTRNHQGGGGGCTERSHQKLLFSTSLCGGINEETRKSRPRGDRLVLASLQENFFGKLHELRTKDGLVLIQESNALSRQRGEALRK